MIAHNLPDGALPDMTIEEMELWTVVYVELSQVPISRTARVLNANEVILKVRAER